MTMATDRSAFNAGLLQFIGASPTPYHACAALMAQLTAQGFQALTEETPWQLQPGGRYFVCRNGASLIAFTVPANGSLDAGIHLVGAHTDSPCLRVKPQPELRRQHYFQLGVEVYGGALLNPWFDRDLSLAGRVDFMTEKGDLAWGLIDLRRAIAVIPSLAIHLDRDANQSHSINAQIHLPPILAATDVRDSGFEDMVLGWLHDVGFSEAAKVLGFELSLYDTQPPAVVGLNGEFIASARLDNLLSCYIGAQALREAGDERSHVLVCTDHEEVGSSSASGAGGTFLRSVLERLVAACSPQPGRQAEEFERVIRHSLMISVDNAHGIHPNYSDKHDGNHGPLLNQGPVIKINANQRYASSSHSVARFRALCLQAEVPVQSFVVRSDMGCGSTIGPITATELGVDTVDIGVPTFAMHSIRELAGSEDAFSLYRALRLFFGATPPAA